jgi:hypothetical protein
VAHLARRPVADEPDGVDRLAGAAGGDEDAHAGEIAPASEHGGRHGDDARGFGQPARAQVTAREPPGLRVDDVDAAPPQRREILLDRGVLPHLGVHRGRDQHRRARREERRGQQVVGDAGGVLAEQLRRRGRDDDQVGRLTEARVRDGLGRVEQRGAGRLRRERGERQLADEAERVAGEHRGDVGARVDQAPADLDRLVGGDPAADAEHDPPAPQRVERPRW